MRNPKEQSVSILNNINKYIIQNTIIKRKQFLLISISGGQDSVCMFFILLQLKKQWGWTFGIVYCNHLWQQNSFYTTLLIIKLGFLFKIPVYITVPISTIFNEKQARYWRYDCFYRLSFFYNHEVVVIGHTYSDKTETILFQLTRGSSTKNFTCLHFLKYFLSINTFSHNSTFSMKYFSNTHILKNIKIKKLFNKNYFSQFFFKKVKLEKPIKLNKPEHFIVPPRNFFKKILFLKNICSKQKQEKRAFILNNPDKTNCSNLLAYNVNKVVSSRVLARPLLSIHRFDLKKLSIFWNLPVYPDKSNQKKNYYRNRIRKQLLPTLRFFFNPQIDTIFLQFSEINTTEQIYLDSVINRLKLEFLNKKHNIFQINISLFSYIPVATQRKLIKYFLENCSAKQIQFFQIESILQSLAKKNKFSKKTKFYFSFNSCIPVDSIVSGITKLSDSEASCGKTMLPKISLSKNKILFSQRMRNIASHTLRYEAKKQHKKYVETQLKYQNKTQIKQKYKQKNTKKIETFKQKITILHLCFLNKNIYIYFTKSKRWPNIWYTSNKINLQCENNHRVRSNEFYFKHRLSINQFSPEHDTFKIQFFYLNCPLSLLLPLLPLLCYVASVALQPKGTLFTNCKIVYKSEHYMFSANKLAYFVKQCKQAKVNTKVNAKNKAKKQVKYFVIKKQNIFNFKANFILPKLSTDVKKRNRVTKYTPQNFSNKIASNISFNEGYFKKFEVYFCSEIGILFCFKKKIKFFFIF